mmetsp:Transcript_59215/g.128695  ORF Transcript_59215/g.128695 Transcript_59215/m.128695 type:complete len:369 (+) Transcript_59215:118-1224(+)
MTTRDLFVPLTLMGSVPRPLTLRFKHCRGGVENAMSGYTSAWQGHVEQTALALVRGVDWTIIAVALTLVLALSTGHGCNVNNRKGAGEFVAAWFSEGGAGSVPLSAVEGGAMEVHSRMGPTIHLVHIPFGGAVEAQTHVVQRHSLGPCCSLEHGGEKRAWREQAREPEGLGWLSGLNPFGELGVSRFKLSHPWSERLGRGEGDSGPLSWHSIMQQAGKQLLIAVRHGSFALETKIEMNEPGGDDVDESIEAADLSQEERGDGRRGQLPGSVARQSLRQLVGELDDPDHRLTMPRRRLVSRSRQPQLGHSVQKGRALGEAEGQPDRRVHGVQARCVLGEHRLHMPYRPLHARHRSWHGESWAQTRPFEE